MRVLIIGAAGFAGRYLAHELLARGAEVVGATRSGGTDEAPAPRPGGRARPDDLPAIELLRCDVTSPEQVEAALAAARPEAIVLLAGLSSPPSANLDPAAAFAIHAMGAVHVLDAVARAGRAIRVALVTSSEVYGRVAPEALPISEESELRPTGIYAASKAAADLAAAAFASAKGVDVVRLRPFNHTGAGQRGEFVCPAFAAQVAAIARGRRAPVMEVGNLDVRRDFSDVRDVVRGYAVALERGRAGEAYNLCSGRAVAIREVLDTLCELAGIRPEVRVERVRQRGAEVPLVVGSAAKAARELGWCCEVPLRRTLADVLDRALDEVDALDGAAA